MQNNMKFSKSFSIFSRELYHLNVVGAQNSVPPYWIDDIVSVLELINFLFDINSFYGLIGKIECRSLFYIARGDAVNVAPTGKWFLNSESLGLEFAMHTLLFS